MSAAQLDLFAPPPRDTAAEAWTTGPVDRSGPALYTHLIRAEDDPERMTREEAHRLGIREVAPHNRLDAISVSEWRRLIRKHLHDRHDDRRECTFNRIMVELADVTADIAFESNADRALWSLVEQGILEHTVEAPLLFRLADPYESTEHVWASLDGDDMWRCHECGAVVPQNRWTREPEGCPRCGLGDASQ